MANAIYNDILSEDERKREAKDAFGNVAASKADLAKDDAFKGLLLELSYVHF